jgi:hypothetical protein
MGISQVTGTRCLNEYAQGQITLPHSDSFYIFFCLTAASEVFFLVMVSIKPNAGK